MSSQLSRNGYAAVVLPATMRRFEQSRHVEESPGWDIVERIR